MNRSSTPPELPRTLEILEASWKLMRACRWRALGYVALIETATVVALTPFLVWCFYRLLSLSGSPIRTNYEIGDFLLSPYAVLLGVSWLFVTTCLRVIERGGLVLILYGQARGLRVNARGALKSTVAAIPRLADRGLFFEALVGVLARPAALAGLGAAGALLLFSRPGGIVFRFVPEHPLAAVAFGVAFALVSVCGLLASVRWAFAVYAVVLEGMPLRAAFARSADLVRGRLARLTVVAVIGYALIAAAVNALTALFVWSGGAILDAMIDQPGNLFTITTALMVVVATAGYSALSWVSMVWMGCLGVVMYRPLLKSAGEEASQRALSSVERAATGVETVNEGKLLRPLAVVVLVGVTATLLTIPGVSKALGGEHREVLITAHRGSSGRAPENTLAALEAAIEDGADYAEIDVQQARDGTIVMIHDFDLSRVAGRPEKVWELTAPELAAVDVGSWFGREFADQYVPTLTEVIDHVRGRLKLNIELKVHGHEEDFAGSFVELIREEEFGDECIVTSLDYATLREVDELEPDLEVGMIVTAALGDVRALEVDFYSVQPLIATARFIADAHDRGLAVHVWTLNEAQDIRTVIDRGADGILSDEPRLAREIVSSRTPADDLRATVVRLFARE